MRLRAIAALLAMMQAGAIGGRTTTHQYALTVYVAEIDQAEDIVTYETHSGHRFEWQGVEDQEAGEVYSLMMDDNGTPETIEDDSIISVRYSGWSIENMH